MKQPRAQGTYSDLQTRALDRVLLHHARTCTYWIFSGDRHCSCGRDAAITELARIRGHLRAVGSPSELAPSGAPKKV